MVLQLVISCQSSFLLRLIHDRASRRPVTFVDYSVSKLPCVLQHYYYCNYYPILHQLLLDNSYNNDNYYWIMLIFNHSILMLIFNVAILYYYWIIPTNYGHVEKNSILRSFLWLSKVRTVSNLCCRFGAEINTWAPPSVLYKWVTQWDQRNGQKSQSEGLGKWFLCENPFQLKLLAAKRC